jgi:hypothetical protein
MTDIANGKRFRIKGSTPSSSHSCILFWEPAAPGAPNFLAGGDQAIHDGCLKTTSLRCFHISNNRAG